MILKKIHLIQILFISLIGVSIFNLLPILSENTVNYAFLLVFGFTALFLFNVVIGSYKYKNNNLNIRTNILYLFLISWTIFILLRGIQFNYNYLRSLFISPYFFLPYLLPFILKYYSIYDFRKIINLIQYINIIYLVCVIFFFIFANNDIIKSVSFIEDGNKYLAFPNFLMLFSFPKLSKKQKVLSIIVFVVGFLISVLAARRSLTWTFSWAFVLFLILNYVHSNSNIYKKIKFIIVFILLGLGLYLVYQKYEDVIFGNLISRIDADTRSSVSNDFKRDMDIESLIFGRGIGGTYTLRETDYDINEDYSNKRNIIEAGYLNIVLNGGYIYLILLFIIYLKSIYNGFKSKNYYSKVCAAFIFLHIMESYPAGVLTFNIRFFLIWFCIAMCWDNKFLESTDKELEVIFNEKQ